jgi:hypothetical protein
MSTPAEPFSEQQLTLAEAARRLPRLNGGRPVAPATLWRWYKHGVKARDGRIVRLQVWRVGGRTVTSPEALQLFFSALNCTCEPARPATPEDKRGNAVEAQLDALGIK